LDDQLMVLTFELHVYDHWLCINVQNSLFYLKIST